METNTDNRINKRIPSKITITVLAIILTIVAFVGGYFSHYLFNGETVNTTIDVLRMIDKVGYVYDEKTGQLKKLSGEQVADILVYSLLDEYSAYYSEKDYEEISAKNSGNYSGLGVVFYNADCIIDKVVGNSPCDKAGIVMGDKIVSGEYGGQTSEFEDYYDMRDFFDLITDQSDITLNIERGASILSFTVSKANYKVSYVKYYDCEKHLYFETSENENLSPNVYAGGMAELDDKTAYISFSAFEGGAANQLIKALDYMKERNRTKLILDLRGNGGGSMDVLSEVAGCLIYANGKNEFLMTTVKGKNTTEEYYSGKNRFNTNIQSIAVLANENSASASECLIGAMSHYGGAFSLDKLVLEKNSEGVAKTYGKGIMQTTYKLISGGYLKLTTARVYWPDGQTCIHGKGITVKTENQVDSASVITRAMQVL